MIVDTKIKCTVADWFKVIIADAHDFMYIC